MEWILIVILIFGFSFIAPIVLFIKTSNLSFKIENLQNQINQLQKRLGSEVVPPQEQTDSQAKASTPEPQPQPQPAPEPKWRAAIATYQKEASSAPAAAAHDEDAAPSYFANLTAGKIFSWTGGFLLFLGIVFALKYAFENNLISPQMRILCGAFLGLGLIAASFFIKAEKFKVTADTLCSAGLAILYGVIFSSKYFYDFITPAQAFFMMGAVALSSFWLASHRKVQYIGYLGVITGFLTPVIVSTGSQNYLMLFAYLALINAGAVAAAIKEGWDKLLCTTAAFTLLFQVVWFFPEFNALRIFDFCVIFAAYTAAAAAVAWLFRNKISVFAKMVFGLYIAASFLFIFLTDFSMPAIILAFFMNALLAALFYFEADVYNVPFKIVNIAVFALLAGWLSSAAGRAENSIILLMASLIFTALNVVVSMSRTPKEDSFTASLPCAALLILFVMPEMSLWALYSFGFIFVAAAFAAATRAENYKAAYAALIIFGVFLLRGIFSTPWYYGFGLFDLLAGMLYTIAFLSVLVFGGIFPKGKANLSITASAMPYLFLLVFILKNPSQEMLGLAFCAGISALVLTAAYFSKNKYLPIAAAACAFLPQIVTAGSAAQLNIYSVIYTAIWALFFAYSFLYKEDDSNTVQFAAAFAGVTILAVAFLNGGYEALTAATLLVTVAYGVGEFFARNKKEGETRPFTVLAWFAFFILINVQIANFYTPEVKVVFETAGDLSKTVAYTLTWGLYGMLTLFAGIWARQRRAMIAGISLVIISLAKLFLSDMWLLSTPYRIVIFIGMAVILIAGSFFYQAFTDMLKNKN